MRERGIFCLYASISLTEREKEREGERPTLIHYK